MQSRTATFWKAYLPIVVGLALTMPLLGVVLLLPPAVWFGVRWAVPRVREGIRLRRELVMRNREEDARRAQEERRDQERERQRLAYEAGEPGRRSERERRHAAKWACEKFFRLHAHELKDRVSQDLFDSLTTRLLADGLAVEVVEVNAEEVLDLMRQHLGRSGAAASGGTLESLAVELEDKRRKILALPMDQKAKDVLIIDLEMRYGDLIKKAITEG